MGFDVLGETTRFQHLAVLGLARLSIGSEYFFEFLKRHTTKLRKVELRLITLYPSLTLAGTEHKWSGIFDLLRQAPLTTIILSRLEENGGRDVMVFDEDAMQGCQACEKVWGIRRFHDWYGCDLLKYKSSHGQVPTQGTAISWVQHVYERFGKPQG